MLYQITSLLAAVTYLFFRDVSSTFLTASTTGKCKKKRHSCGHLKIDAFYVWPFITLGGRLVGLVVKASASRAEDPGFESRLRLDFSGSSHTSDFKIGTPVATLPGAWSHRVSAGTGRPGVSILWLGEIERWACNFYHSVAARKIVWADPFLKYTLMLLGR